MVNKIRNLVLISLVIFAVNVIFWYLPIYYKGYPPEPVDSSMILARNLATTGVYAMESQNGVILSSSQAAQGIIDKNGNNLTPLIYSQIIKYFQPSLKTIQLIPIIVFALTNVLLFLFFTKLFGLKVGIIYSFISILMPVIWRGALIPGFYEWANLFFAVGFILYWSKERRDWRLMLLAGVFFSLVIMARNAYLFSILAILFFDLLDKKSIKRLIIFGLPILIFFLGPFFYSSIQKGNLYVDLNTFSSYGHCFSDPYTFFNNRDAYVQANLDTNDEDVSQCFKIYGYSVKTAGLLNNWFYSTKYYAFNLIDQTTYGGPLVLLLGIFGTLKLKKEKPKLYKLFILWPIVLFVSLIYLKTSNWDHFLEISIPIILMVSLGVSWLLESLVTHLKLDSKKTKQAFLTAFVVLILAVHFLLSAKWLFQNAYTHSLMNETNKLAGEIKKNQIGDNEVIACGRHNSVIYQLNYFTDKNFIKFSDKTIEKLLTENKLKQIFEQYGVTMIVGYENDLSKEIYQQTTAEIIY